jgi:hypothetical protein
MHDIYWDINKYYKLIYTNIAMHINYNDFILINAKINEEYINNLENKDKWTIIFDGKIIEDIKETRKKIYKAINYNEQLPRRSTVKEYPYIISKLLFKKHFNNFYNVLNDGYHHHINWYTLYINYSLFLSLDNGKYDFFNGNLKKYPELLYYLSQK